jgi:hypothetical protein
MKKNAVFLLLTICFCACTKQEQFYVSRILSPQSIRLEDGTVVTLIGVTAPTDVYMNALNALENQYVQLYDENYDPVNELTGEPVEAYVFDLEGDCINDLVNEGEIYKIRLHTGDTPYEYIYGPNKACPGNNCSKVTVKTPENSDVLVTVKENDRVVRHAYIEAADEFSFSIPNGLYQVFFYYGKEWEPGKFMKSTPQGDITGGFAESEYFAKDNPQVLNSQELTYTLILQTSGNFSTIPSNVEEAL